MSPSVVLIAGFCVIVGICAAINFDVALWGIGFLGVAGFMIACHGCKGE